MSDAQPNATEQALDATIMDALGRWTEGHMTNMSSPNGLGPGTGRWWLVHACPDPRTFTPFDAEGSTFEPVVCCQGCGQRYEYRAFAADFDNPLVQWTYEAHMKRRYPPDGIPPWGDDDPEED